jgi:hypothetical protein
MPPSREGNSPDFRVIKAPAGVHGTREVEQ